MSTPDQPPTNQPLEGAPEVDDATPPGTGKPQARARSSASRATGPTARPKQKTSARTTTAGAPTASSASPEERRPGSGVDERGRLSGVAGIDRPDPFQRGRRIWPD